MESNQVDPVGQQSDSNKSVTSVPVDNDSRDQQQKDFVSLETHRRLLDEKKKMQDEKKKIQAQLEQLLQVEKERQEADARKRGDYETLIKTRDEELAKERQRRIDLESHFIKGQKLSAVIDALGGNVEQKWIRLIDADQVVLNPETGEIDPLSVAKVAESLKTEWPEMLKPGKTFPQDAPKGLHGGNGRISRDEWLKLSSKDMLKWKADQIVD